MRKASSHASRKTSSSETRMFGLRLGLLNLSASSRGLQNSNTPQPLCIPRREAPELRRNWEFTLRKTLGTEALLHAGKLLSQQIWLWGRDVHPPGTNWLLKYGFTRHGIPPGRQGCSCYSWNQPEGGSVWLWSFGLFFSRPGIGAIYLRRFEFLPRLSRSTRLPKPVWSDSEFDDHFIPINATERASALDLLAESCRWIADYERWILTQCGLEYRRQTLNLWTSPASLPEEIIPGWENLERLCRTRTESCSEDSTANA